MNQRIVIIGTSAAAVGAITRLRQLMPQATILALSQEKESPYNKCLLADYAIGLKQESDLYTLKRFAQDPLVEIRRGIQVEAIIPESSTLKLHDGNTISYDCLLLAMGSSPIFFFHTLHDVNTLLNYCRDTKARTALIIGAGLSGLECADALHKNGLKVAVVEREKQVLPASLTATGAQFIAQTMHAINITFYPETMVVDIEMGENQITRIVTEKGHFLSADVIVVATGLKPNSALAAHAGIACMQGSVMVDNYLQTSIPGIFAAGDLIVTKNQLTGYPIRSTTWPDAMMQGGYAAFAMAGLPKPYPGIVPILSSSFFGLTCAIGGAPEDPDLKIQERQTPGSYSRHAFDENGRLRGFIAIGDQISWVDARRALLSQEVFQLT